MAEETKTDTASKTMKAIVCTAYGEPKDVLQLIEVAMPEPKPKELLVQIYSAALNPVDYKMVKGWLSMVSKKRFPWIPGRDFAGRVVKIGHKVTPTKLNDIQIGTFVCGMISHFANDGTLAEYICITPEYCKPFPINKITLNEAASIPLSAMTAYQAIMEKGAFKSGGKVLILGGSSGCGVYAIQIAKLYGAAKVVVTSSQVTFCQCLGADLVLNYKDKNVPIWYDKLKGEDYDVIFDCVGGIDSWDNAYKVLAKNGSFVTIVGDSEHGEKKSVGGIIGIGASVINRKFWSLWGNPNYVNFLMDPVGGLCELLQAVDDGKLKAILDDSSPYKLNEFVEMFEKQMSHTAHGKLVLELKKYDTQNEKEENKENKKAVEEKENNDMESGVDNEAITKNNIVGTLNDANNQQQK